MGNRRTLTLTLLLLVALALAACGPVSDVIGDRQRPTPTARPLLTATPGGRLSVWLTTPTARAGVGATPSPVGGNPVGPNATATADLATRVAATQTAAAPGPAPYLQVSRCPAPGNPAPPPRPASFGDYSVVIGRFLSLGGAPTVLEAALRGWSAITDAGGLVQADTDLTGDGVLEVVVTLYNPDTYNAEAPLNAGQMLVYGCENGGYRLLYQTAFNPGLAIPRLSRVGDMNADVKNELVYYTESCAPVACLKEARILSWNAVVGAFEELNSGQIIAINGRIGIADVDEDGVLELTAQINPPDSSQTGPGRSMVDTWDWNGLEYLLALREEEGARYRIHAIYDADDLLAAEQWRDAILAYDGARKDADLQTWTVAGDRAVLNAYAAYRIVITYAYLGNARASTWLNTLQEENQPGTPGYPFAQIGGAFMRNFRATRDSTAACAEALTAPGSATALRAMNNYGSNNRTYALDDLCPF